MIYDDLEIEDKIEDIPVQNLLAVVENSKVKDFLLAGNCRCNIENLKTGNRFTYKIKRSKDVKHMYFVYVESGLGDIYGGYFYVNANVFDYRKDVKSITLPKSLTKIHRGAFIGCKSLTEIIIDPEHPGMVMHDDVLYDREMTTLLLYPT